MRHAASCNAQFVMMNYEVKRSASDLRLAIDHWAKQDEVCGA
jgi:hypothetical protein